MILPTNNSLLDIIHVFICLVHNNTRVGKVVGV